VLLNSCFTEEPDRHDGFESISGCFVYQYEVESDWHLFGTVEYIDTSKASRCAKTQLQNTYLLTLNDSIVIVHGVHPKNDIDEIKKQYQIEFSDTTKLTRFTKHNDGYSVILGRLLKDSSHFRNNSFVDWKLIKYKEHNFQLIKTEEELLTFWYNWNK